MTYLNTLKRLIILNLYHNYLEVINNFNLYNIYIQQVEGIDEDIVFTKVVRTYIQNDKNKRDVGRIRTTGRPRTCTRFQNSYVFM